MLVKDLFEDSWSGANNAWHNQGQSDQWYDGVDQWHGQEGGGMVEDFAVANLIANEDISDVVTARGLIGRAVRDAAAKHEYFEFLKHLRSVYGSDYSTEVHQQAAKLAKVN
jgi:hypothetical protein